ncbi:metal ABC transporter permease [Bradyrhizobium sp. 162]|nr:metal ABC transporter permease [Bradyrhizobium sp. 162]
MGGNLGFAFGRQSCASKASAKSARERAHRIGRVSGQILGVLIDPFASFGFMRIALVACFALALANGPMGTLLLMRRESLDGNVLSHAVMPGAALGFLYAGYSLAALTIGGLLTGLAVAALAALSAGSRWQRQDSNLIAFYLICLSFGVLIVAARSSQADLVHVLFGTVLAVDVKALLLMASISSATMLVVAALYRPLVVESFDPAFLRAVGGGGGAFRAIFVTLVVLNLVASFQAFGTLLAIGPMLLPAAAARCWTNKVFPMIVLATVLGMAAALVGLLVSYYANLPSGPVIVISAGVIYGMSLLAAGRTWLKPEGLRKKP